MTKTNSMAEHVCRLLVLLLLTGSVIAEDCLLDRTGLKYTGQIAKTVTGKTCARWSVTPKCNAGLVERNSAEAENFCRNPSGFDDCKLSKPWCYTTGTTVPYDREYCDVPLCGYKTPACSHALGMENGNIADSQITATSSMSGHEPYRARLNSGNDDERAGWVASTANGLQTLKIDLKTMHNVTKVILQGSGKTANAWTTQFKVQYSEDGNSWSFYKERFEVKLFEGNPARYHGISHTFDPPLRTRFFAVNPMTWHNKPALRLEVHGCAISSRVRDTITTASTTVLGRLHKNTCLRKKDTPYLVSEEIIVPAGIVLTIEAGTQIQFKKGGITVEGVLKILGEESDEVLIISTDVSRRWSGITFKSNKGRNADIVSNTGSTTDAIGSLLRHVRLINTFYGVIIEGPPPRLEHVTVFNSAASGVWMTGLIQGNVTISHCNFSNNQDNGIFIELDKSKANVDIIGTTTNNNGATGMSLRNVMSGTVRFLNNTINNNLRLALIVYQMNASVVIGNNSFINNSRLSDREGFTVKLTGVSGGQIYIVHNVFVDNINYHHQLLIGYKRPYQVVYIDYRNTTHLKVTGNIFRNNTGCGAITIYAASQSVCRGCEMENNVFINNSKPTVPVKRDYKNSVVFETIRMTGKFHLSLKNNYFDNPGAKFEVTMPLNDGEITDASGSYWGKLSYSDIVDRVECFHSNLSLGVIKVWPYRVSPNNKKLVQRSAEYWFVSKGLGGILVTDMTIHARQAPYVVERSIHVSENVTLTVEAGVSLLFKDSRGIQVKGKLHLQGSADTFIHLSQYSPRRGDLSSNGTNSSWWAGIILEKVSRTNELLFSNVAISGSDGGLRIHKEGTVKIHNCRFYKNNKALQLLSERIDVTIANSEFHSNNYGINFVDGGKFAIRGCRFTGQDKAVIKGSPGSPRQRPETATISDNVFVGNNGSIKLDLSRKTSLHLLRNTFEHSAVPETRWYPRGAVDLDVIYGELIVQGNNFHMVKSTGLYIWMKHTYLVIKNNTWKYSGRAISTNYMYGHRNQTTIIENNVFHAGISSRSVISLDFAGNSTIKVRSNTFTENRGTRAIHLDEGIGSDPLEVYWNIFSMNTMSVGVIEANRQCEIHYNTFNNPNSKFDYITKDSYTPLTRNATYNWWAVDTLTEVSKRIRIIDRHGVERKDDALFEPFLTHPPRKSCSKVNNCSGHGDCVLQNTCECHTGWTGRQCDRCGYNYYGPKCLPSLDTTTPRTKTTTEKYSSTKTITTSMPLTKTTTPETQQPSTPRRTETISCYIMDVAFAVDAAGSIVKENWSYMADFFDRFLAQIDVNPNCARVSIVTFGSAATLQFGLTSYDDANSLRQALEGLSVDNQSRNFAEGIRMLRSGVFDKRYGDRKDAPNMCVLITDGASGVEQQNALAEANLAKSAGINLQVIGIGKNVRLSELSSIASTNAIHLSDFPDLNGAEALQNLYSYMEDFKQTPASTTTATTITKVPSTTSAVTFSWHCSFESSTGRGSLCGMTQSSSDDFDWTLGSGPTPSSETGPNSGSGGSGHYIYIEASQPRRNNDKAMIMLPSLKQNAVYCLSFYYNMNGYHINTLQVVKHTTSGQHVNLWMKKGNRGPQWHTADVSADLHSSDQLAFIGLRGEAFSGDIAVDNISIRLGSCTE